MNVDDIRKYCLAFPGATETMQWGDALCFKVRGKMFAVLGLDRVRFTFKCTPDSFAELIEREGIQPSPYVGRYHWVMLDRLNVLSRKELEDLVRRSYEIVESKAPGSARKKAKKKVSKKKAVASKARAKKSSRTRR